MHWLHDTLWLIVLCSYLLLFIHDDQYPHGQLFEEPINVAIVGPAVVGKSAITSRLISNYFIEGTDSFILQSVGH